MRTRVAVELRKMRRLHTLPLLAVMVAAVAALSSASQFTAGTEESFQAPGARPWATLLLTYTLMAAMTSPVVVAVVASRQTEIEHAGAGWNLAAVSGVTAGSLCRAKVAALMLLMAPAVAAQTLLVVGLGRLAGLPGAPAPLPWLGYTVLLLLVDVAFCAVHVWLAALVDNQLVSVGVGMLGAFVAVVCLLLPAPVGLAVPWGYYAVISHAAQVGDVVVYVAPPYGWVAGFLLLVGAGTALATRRLDRVWR